MLTKEKMDFATKQVVNVCLKAKKGEKATVITDKHTKNIGMAIANQLKKTTGDVKVFLMEDFGNRPDDGSSPLEFPDEIKNFLLSADISIYAAQGKKGEVKTFRAPMLNMVHINSKLRHGHMIFVNDVIMETGMSVDYAKVKEITQKIFEIASPAKKINVTTKLGTNLIVEFDPVLKWVCFDGCIQPGHWSNLPEGEVFTCPQNISGTLIVDGVLGDYLVKYGLIEKHPVCIEIKDSRAISVTCSNKMIEEELKNFFKQEENANRVGEFAIGTNIGLKNLIGNLLQDEKFPGVHVAFGHPFPKETGAKWDANSHLDMVIQKTTIEVDDKTIMKDGKFLI